MARLAQITQNFQKFQMPHDLPLNSGQTLRVPQIAYETYGTLNHDKSNAVLICHGFTADQFAASEHPLTGKAGWWAGVIGPGKPIDTDKYFVISTNVIGGAMGSSSPCTINPETQKYYGIDFPIVTIPDMVRGQISLLDHFGIERLLSAIGGSMGGMQVLELARQATDRVRSVMPIACSWRYSTQNIAFQEIGRRAIMADPAWCGGDYLNHEAVPSKGLALARMVAHITYMSEQSLQQKFGRSLQRQKNFSFDLQPDFQIENYLDYQGSSFVERFDANCYLYLTRALDYYDLTIHPKMDTLRQDPEAAAVDLSERLHLTEVFRGTKTKFCLIAFTTDWLFPPSQSKEIVRALNIVDADVSFVIIESDRGHDSFLLDPPEMLDAIKGFLDRMGRDL